MTVPSIGIETFTGRWFDYENPTLADVDIRDIAHGLASIARYGGHVRRPYSVAQHSVLCSKRVPVEHALAALLHDAHEAYIGDCPSPLKRLLPDFRRLEARVERVVRAKFGLPAELPPEVKEADMRMLVTEAKAFGMSWWSWPRFEQFPPYAELADLEPWPWAKAEHRFLDRFEQLTAGR